MNIISSEKGGSRDLVYILIISGLLIALFLLYDKYQNDSYSRVVGCFENVVEEPEFCESFYDAQDVTNLISIEDASEIIYTCLNEYTYKCEEENISDNECASQSVSYCNAKHPKTMKIFLEKYTKDKE